MATSLLHRAAAQLALRSTGRAGVARRAPTMWTASGRAMTAACTPHRRRELGSPWARHHSCWRSSPMALESPLFRAKGKKKKGKKGKAAARAEEPGADSEAEADPFAEPAAAAASSDDEEPLDMEALQEEMDRHLEFQRREYAKLRIGAASPTMLDHVMVKAYDDVLPLPQLAQVSAVSPQLLAVSVFDPTLANAVHDAIRDAGLNLNPQVDGNNTVKVPIPKTTKETRVATVKAASELAESAKTAVRHSRKKALDALKKGADGLSEDDVFRWQKDVQEVTDSAIADITAVFKAKEGQAMEG